MRRALAWVGAWVRLVLSPVWWAVLLVVVFVMGIVDRVGRYPWEGDSE